MGTIRGTRGHWANLAFTIIMWILGLLMIFPFVTMVAISFRPAGLTYKPLFYPVTPILTNYLSVLGHQDFLNWCLNTVLTVVIAIAIRLTFTLPAAYAFARLPFRGRAMILFFLLATLMVPGETTMVPRYLYFKSIGLLDSIWVIVLPEVSEVFYLLLLTTFFRAIPQDYNEAAYLDGASHLRILTSIYVPLSGPVISTAILFSFINIWNNFLDPYIFISTMAHQLLTPALKYFQQQGGANIPEQLSGASIVIIPIIVLFILTQKYFVEGISSGGLKG